MEITEILEALSVMAYKRPRRPVPAADDYLSTGCTLLNLSLSGKTDGGVLAGTYVYFVGDSSSGKTWFSFSLFAEAGRNPRFRNHRLIYDNAENGALMDVEKYFGKRTAAKLESPKRNPSHTVEEFYYNLDDAHRDGRPYIYVLDSMDAIESEKDEEHFLKKKGSTSDETKGTYGVNKAKENSKNIKRYATRLADTGSILVVLSQTRDKIGSFIPGDKTRSGGKSLKFYAHTEVWTSIAGRIKRKVRGKERKIGSYIQMDVQKNRQSGWDYYKVVVPFHRTLGFDDVGGCVDFLVEEGHWKGPKKDKGLFAKKDKDAPKQIEAPEFEFTGGREDLVRLIESADAEDELRRLVQAVLDDIDKGCAVVRKPRYEE